MKSGDINDQILMKLIYLSRERVTKACENGVCRRTYKRRNLELENIEPANATHDVIVSSSAPLYLPCASPVKPLISQCFTVWLFGALPTQYRSCDLGDTVCTRARATFYCCWQQCLINFDLKNTIIFYT